MFLLTVQTLLSMIILLHSAASFLNVILICKNMFIMYSHSDTIVFIFSSRPLIIRSTDYLLLFDLITLFASHGGV